MTVFPERGGNGFNKRTRGMLMYSKEIFAGIDLYSLLIVLGVFACMWLIRLQGDWRHMRAKLQNLLIWTTVAAVVLGYGFAVLFQAFYNYMAKGVFEIVNNTGSTFYGGLIGGTAVYIGVYFLAGHFLFPDGYHKRQFRTVSDLAAACITGAHGFGRLGCLMAGCCHGRPTDAWYGIYMNIPGDGTAEKVKVIPVQLYEALFLFALCALFLFLFKKGKKYLLPSYMMAYAVWRFVAEILRGDYRGATVVDFFTPSQFISVLLLAGGLVLLGIQLYVDERHTKRSVESPATSDEPVTAESDAALPKEEDAAPADEGETP